MQSNLGKRSDVGHAQKRSIPAGVHPFAGVAAILIILAFQGATVGVELAGDAAVIASVKSAIWYAIPLLVLALALAGGSGSWLARGNASRVVKRKRRRMALAAGNGLLVLIPSAFLLQRWANAGDLGAGFYALQALELAAGLTNLMLLVRNAQDGRKLAGRGRPRGRPGTVGAPD